MVDYPLIAFLGGITKGEMAMITEQKPFNMRVGFVNFGGRFRKLEPRHDVVDDGESITKNLFANGVGIGLVGQHQKGCGVGVVHEFVRQKCVKKCFHRRVWRAAVQEIAALRVDHILVA